jgi:hypothetical protein
MQFYYLSFFIVALDFALFDYKYNWSSTDIEPDISF